MNARAYGMGLIELIVALTLLSVGVLGLAGAATFAHRAFASAEAIDRGVAAAAAVLDSLMYVSEPAAGERAVEQATLSWTVAGHGSTRRITLLVQVDDAGQGHTLIFEAVHSGHLVR